MAANAKSVLFGNFQNYFIRDIAPSMQMMVLRERYADYLQVGYIAFLRSDGNLISAASPIVVYSNSAT
jgi:HK97 family phage major capsid protein